jgi:hypothetical protein
MWSVAPGGLLRAVHHGATPRVIDPSRSGVRWYRAPNSLAARPARPARGARPAAGTTTLEREEERMGQGDPSQLVYLGRYPVHSHISAPHRKAVAAAREKMRTTGAADARDGAGNAFFHPA